MLVVGFYGKRKKVNKSLLNYSTPTTKLLKLPSIQETFLKRSYLAKESKNLTPTWFTLIPATMRFCLSVLCVVSTLRYTLAVVISQKAFPEWWNYSKPTFVMEHAFPHNFISSFDLKNNNPNTIISFLSYQHEHTENIWKLTHSWFTQ